MIELHPGISGLDKDSLCYSLYIQLYTNFFNAQIKKDDANPYGIEEGDETSIRLRNTAYNFADAISVSINGEGSGEGGLLLDYLKKSGGDMFGLLTANYGFEAGIKNHKLMQVYCNEYIDTEEEVVKEKYGVRFTGDIEIGANNLFIGGSNILSLDNANKTTILKGEVIKLFSPLVSTEGEIKILNDKKESVVLNKYGIKINGHTVYHSGNSNLSSVDWTMFNANVEGGLTVKGTVELNGSLRALNGIELGDKNEVYIFSGSDKINFKRNLSFDSGYGLSVKDTLILSNVNDTDIQLSGVGGDLLIGSEKTNKIRLLSNVTDIDGQYVLISKYGAAYFPESLTVRHNHGKVLLSTYKKNAGEGVVIHEKLRLGSPEGPAIQEHENGISFFSSFIVYDGDGRNSFAHSTTFRHAPTISRYKPLDRLSNTSFIVTDTDFFSFCRPVEAENYIGINDSLTRLTKDSLFFSDEKFILSAKDGLKHYGNAYFLNDIGSEKFSSGFAGSGWKISKNQVTGNIAATFDELTIRKKMRIYELEVQKISATNGSLWVSDNCQGDTVVKL